MTENTDQNDEHDEWQIEEIRKGIAELDAGDGIDHEEVVKWLNTWGKPGEADATAEIMRILKSKEERH